MKILIFSSSIIIPVVISFLNWYLTVTFIGIQFFHKLILLTPAPDPQYGNHTLFSLWDMLLNRPGIFFTIRQVIYRFPSRKGRTQKTTIHGRTRFEMVFFLAMAGCIFKFLSYYILWLTHPRENWFSFLFKHLFLPEKNEKFYFLTIQNKSMSFLKNLYV